MNDNIVLAYKEDGEDLKITTMNWQDVMVSELGYSYVGDADVSINTRSLLPEERTDLNEFFKGNLQLTVGITTFKATLKDESLPIEELLENCHVVK